MADDPPFRAEYAKSGRAGCKGCKTNISQGSLRIAKMVQSPHFDGKIPTWFHFHCFFKKSAAKSEEEFGNFESLRWDDQEKIRGHIKDAPPLNSKGKGKKGFKKSVDVTDGLNNNNGEFSVEYAKSGRAKCRKCEDKIEKEVIRISKMMESETAYVSLVPHWHHVNCFVDCRRELDADQLEAKDIPGFQTLSEEDRKDLSKKLKVTKKKKIKVEEKPMKEEIPDKNTKCKNPVSVNEEEKNTLKKQNQEFWKIRDQLHCNCSNRDLKEMLESNGCNPAGGEDSLLDRCADGIMFGAMEPCQECTDGKFVYSATKNSYICTGNISGWTKCINTTQTPNRKPWKISKELKKENSYLNSFELKVGERKFPSKSAQKSIKAEEKESDKTLQNKKIVIVGKLKQNQKIIAKRIEELGGHISESVTIDCFCCISSPAEVLKGTKKMDKVEHFDIPVVAEEYVDAVKKGGAQLLLPQYAIAPWGGERDFDVVDGTANKSVGKKRKLNEQAASSSKKSKMTLKGGAVVDPDSGLEDKYHVLKQDSELYSCVLGMVDLIRGSNSYYKIQVLQHDKNIKKFQLFRSWGRVGTKIGSSKLEKFFNKEDAIEHFKDVYVEKTGNQWEMRKNFVKYPSKFYPIDIDYGQDDEDLLAESISPGSNKSTLPSSVQNLIKMIFDIEAMKQSLVEFEIDLKKMPLGKLSRKQIEMAYACLSECQQYLKDGITGTKVLDASNRFFTLIPHDFGMKIPPLLDKQEIISMKIDMLDSLLEIEIAYSLLKGAREEAATKDPLDVHYESLKTDIKVLEQDDEEFKMICEYVKNTHAKTHSSYKLKVKEVFAVDRHGENQRYRPFCDLHNRQLLWHGSRKTNFVGILSQGLRIAPPEAPVTGYMFGKGVYFADMVSKSANYCYTSSSNNIGLMLLCEVALGNMYEIKHSEHITRLPVGKHSCKGLGSTGPDTSAAKVLPDGVTVPLGKSKHTTVRDSSLLYNEYIVYDTSQIKMKYLIQLEFKYRW